MNLIKIFVEKVDAKRDTIFFPFKPSYVYSSRWADSFLDGKRSWPASFAVCQLVALTAWIAVLVFLFHFILLLLRWVD